MHGREIGLFLLCASAGSALAQVTTATFYGIVTDPTGAVVPGAAVTLTHEGTSTAAARITDAAGEFGFDFLRVGAYTLQIEARGFKKFESKGIELAAGQAVRQTFALEVGAITETVSVAGVAPLVSTASAEQLQTFENMKVTELPLGRRNVTGVLRLSTGVDIGSNRNLRINGVGSNGTGVSVDGTDANSYPEQRGMAQYGARNYIDVMSIDAVQEVQLVRGILAAEYGGVLGGQVNLIAKSGTNNWHGSAFEYFRDESLNSNTPILTARGAKRPKSQINQFGGTVGGPIKRDRAFFFAAFDGQRSTIPNVVDAPNFFAQPVAIQALLAPKMGTYNVGRDQNVYMFKTDVRLNSSNQLVLRFNQQNFTGNNNENGGPLSVQEHSGNSVAKTTTFSGSLASTLTNTVINEFRFQFGRDSEPGEANSSAPEARIQTGGGFLQLGRNNFSPRETTIRRWQFIDNVSYTRGAHSLKFGADLNFDRIFNFFPGLFSGQYTFNSYALFASNTPSAFTQNFPGAGTSGGTTHPDLSDYGFFGQDDWRVNPKLTLNLGLRYDYQKLKAPTVNNPSATLAALGLSTTTPVRDGNNFAPRFGFSYAFNEKTVARGGYGIFFARTTAIMLGTAHSQNGIQVTGVSLNCTLVPNPCLTYPAIFTTPPAAGGLTPSLYLFAKDYAQPYVQQGRLGVERELVPNLSLSVTYMYFHGVHLSRTRDINLGVPVPTVVTDLSGNTFTVLRHPATRPIPGFTRISLFESTADSHYNGLAVELKRRFTRGFQFIMAYTYSGAKDNKPDQTMVVVGTDDVKGVQNNLNISADWGRSDLDIRHRFVFSPVYEIGRVAKDNTVASAFLSNWTFSGIVTLQSGFAYSAMIAGDANRDGNSATDRVPGTARNAFTTPSIYVFDTRVTKSIKFGEKYNLSFIAEAFNLFNRSNIATVNTGRYGIASSSATTLTNPALSTPFGFARTFLGERQIQLAARFRF